MYIYAIIMIVTIAVLMILVVKIIFLQDDIRESELKVEILTLLNKQIDDRDSRIEIIEEKVKILQIWNGAEEFRSIRSPENIYSKMTIGKFRKLSGTLIERIDDSIEKTAVINFLKEDLVNIDTSRARFELMKVQKESSLEKKVSFISDSGDIIWADSDEVPNPKLIIGKPKLRVEYYDSIINLLEKLSKK